jgi:hypothetical protein
MFLDHVIIISYYYIIYIIISYNYVYIYIYIYIIFFLHWQLWKRDEKGTSTEDLVNAAGWERFCHVATVPGNPLDERHHCIVLQYGGASKSPTFREAFIYFIFLYATLSEELV